MSISDTLMWRYFELLSFRSIDAIAKLKAECAGGRNPREAKVMLAQEIVERFHSRAAAEHATTDFEAQFRDGATPGNMPEVTVQGPAGADFTIAQLAKASGATGSTSEALRLIAQRGLKVDGEVVTDGSRTVAAGQTVVVQAGKRKFVRVTVR